MRLIDADNLIERVKAAPIREKNKVIGLIHTERTAPVKTGKWIKDNHQIKCSICGNPIPIRRVMFRGEIMWEDDSIVKYCPNCGAKMENDDATN